MSAKVMIVDDNAFARTMLKNIIADEGYDVVAEACNGATAIAMYQELNPDLITMDITMPDMNGIDAVRGILAVDPKAKIIMVSAMNQSFFVMEALEAGAMDFIAKPFDRERIIRAFERLLTRHTG